MVSNASYLLWANSPLTLTSCPQLAQVSSAANAGGTETQIRAAYDKGNIAKVDIRANAKPMSGVNSFILIFKSFTSQPGNAKIYPQSPLPSAGKTEISAALVQPLFQMACKLVKRK